MLLADEGVGTNEIVPAGRPSCWQASSTPANVASALTEGYGRAIDLGVLILVAASAVASVAIAPLRRAAAPELAEEPLDAVEIVVAVEDAEMEAESA